MKEKKIIFKRVVRQTLCALLILVNLLQGPVYAFAAGKEDEIYQGENKYKLEENTGIKVNRVNVIVRDIKLQNQEDI